IVMSKALVLGAAALAFSSVSALADGSAEPAPPPAEGYAAPAAPPVYAAPPVPGLYGTDSHLYGTDSRLCGTTAGLCRAGSSASAPAFASNMRVRARILG